MPQGRPVQCTERNPCDVAMKDKVRWNENILVIYVVSLTLSGPGSFGDVKDRGVGESAPYHNFGNIMCIMMKPGTIR